MSSAVTLCASIGRGGAPCLEERPEGAVARACARVGDFLLRGVLLPVEPLRGRDDFGIHLRGLVSAQVDAARSCCPPWWTAAARRSACVRYRPRATSTARPSAVRTARVLATTSWLQGRGRPARAAASAAMVELEAVTFRPLEVSAKAATPRAIARAVTGERCRCRHRRRPSSEWRATSTETSHSLRLVQQTVGARPGSAHE